jgi:succinyl-diaminopimelate desuccinylase
MGPATLISQEVVRNRERIITLAQKLIRVPSFSGDAEGLSRMAAIIAPEMKDMGFSVELPEAEKGLTNVVGKFSGSDTAPCILFNGHTDVVPVTDERDWEMPPFNADISDGRIYGRGACDMKGGVTAMLAAPRVVFSLLPEFTGNIILTTTVDEEIGGFKGMKYVMEQGIRADMGIVCEPTNLKIVNVCKGLLWLKLKTRGKAAHGGMPENGINAVYKMSKILGRLENYDFGQHPHPVLGKPTVNVGSIKGGSKPNMVPDSCEAEIDIRYLPAQDHRKIIDELKGIIAGLKKEDDQIEAELEMIRYRRSIEIPKESVIIKTIMEGVRDITGDYPGSTGMISPADSEYLVNSGILAVMFGPGQDSLCHTANEWIAIDDILEATKMYAAIIIRSAGLTDKLSSCR